MMSTRAKAVALARGLLSEPSCCPPTGLLAKIGPALAASSNWQQFLTQRGWVSSRWAHAEEDRQHAAITALSAALTYPLTCAHAWPLAALDTCASVRLCIVGARAEATLPAVIWRELCELLGADVTVDMSGPTAKAVTQELAESGRGRLSIVQSEPPNFFHRGSLGTTLLASVQNSTAPQQEGKGALLELPDAFVLFNPGFGEPGWERSWKLTVDALFASRRPIVFTALSVADAERDALFWANATGDVLNYRENPWSSLLVEESTGNRSNHMVAVWRTAGLSQKYQDVVCSEK